MQKLKLAFIQDDQVTISVPTTAENGTTLLCGSVRYALKHTYTRGGLILGTCLPENSLACKTEKIPYTQIKPGDILVNGNRLIICYENCAAPGCLEAAFAGRVKEEALASFTAACTKIWYREYHLRTPSYIDLEAEE